MMAIGDHAPTFALPIHGRPKMATPDPVLYIDLGSPYAYLAFERAPSVLGADTELEPVLLGAIFARRGFGSWSQTPAREGRIAELEERARRYGLPAFRWPPGWPANGLGAMRCAMWAKQEGALEAFARAVFREQFVNGGDISQSELLLECAGRAGLNPLDAARAIEAPRIKLALREASDAAWDAGVRGVPSVRVGESIFYGDDQLELAAITS
jgi:2-hydroxychromene-2-carboxylate isomerase